ncbi:DNA-binding protein [Lactobacillus johnsonii]|uniref:DNA-binding protein n=1 Tax=Lactobacillus johnsonii TaxID=33959 RepID=UPI003D1619A9
MKLDASQEKDLSNHIINLVKDSVKQAINNESKSYLNRKEIVKYFGIADSTISYWATLGMPVSVIDGRKLYGKQSITNWLKSKKSREKLKQFTTYKINKTN